MSIDNSKWFKYKAALVGKASDTVSNTNSSVQSTKIVAPLKCLSNFWRLLETQSINSKIHLKLTWIEKYILSSTGDSARIKITDAKLLVSIVTLSTKDSVNLTILLSDGFKRSFYWNSYQTIPAKII